jgi:hypothetical protein
VAFCFEVPAPGAAASVLLLPHATEPLLLLLLLQHVGADPGGI